MMEITAADVSLAENNDGGLVKGDTLSPLPALENLSISTESTEATSNNEDISSSDFNDCSSSISSQDSNNFVATGNRTVKRSVFSQYWKKTGQKPVQLRPIKPLERPSQSEPSSLVKSSSPSTLPARFDPSIATLSKADLLEDDECDSDSDSQFLSHEEPKKSLEQVAASPAHGQRRSILPPPPVANAAFKSWSRKPRSASFSHLETCSPSKHKLLTEVDSIPRRRSASSLNSRPGPSCLRPYQRYSLSTASSSSFEGAKATRRLSRSDSSSSSVSFQETVDIRHFEPPHESYAGKGWSEHFYWLLLLSCKRHETQERSHLFGWTHTLILYNKEGYRDAATIQTINRWRYESLTRALLLLPFIYMLFRKEVKISNRIQIDSNSPNSCFAEDALHKRRIPICNIMSC